MDAITLESTFDSSVRAAERQRISRELHSSTSQLLIALQLQLGQLRRSLPPGTAEDLLYEIAEILQDIHESIKQVGMQRGDATEAAFEDRLIQTAKLFYSLSGAGRACR